MLSPSKGTLNKTISALKQRFPPAWSSGGGADVQIVSGDTQDDVLMPDTGMQETARPGGLPGKGRNLS